MKGFSAILLLAIPCLYLARDVRALAVPKENLEDMVDKAEEDAEKLTKTDEDQILELREQVLKLQQSVAEITRSFLALELIAKNPSLMDSLMVNSTNENNVDNSEKKRLRRDANSQTSPTSSSPSDSSSSGQQTSIYTGPYVWPVFSGQYFLCPAGVPGPRGPPGPQGIPGKDGRDGRDATTSAQANMTNAEYSCPQFWHLFEGNCYLHQGDRVTWPDAEARCNTYFSTGGNAHLVSIHSVEENRFVYQLFKNNAATNEMPDWVYSVQDRNPFFGVWIGLHQAVADGPWVNSDGSADDYQNWKSNEPNNRYYGGEQVEDCVHIWRRSAAYDTLQAWNDLYCQEVMSFVCKMPAYA